MYGMCHQRYRHHDEWRGQNERYEEPGPVAVAERDPDERVSDVDRERAAARLSEAFRDGVLRVEEFDERLSAAYAAQTVADLESAMVDLPRDWLGRIDAAEEHERRARRHQREWRGGFQAYRGVMLLLVAIWFFTSLQDFTFLGGDGDTYFWPIWPMLGWGIPLFLSRPRRSGRREFRDEAMARAR